MMTIRQEIFNALALTKYTVELSNKTRGTDNERTSVPFLLMSAPGYGKTTIIKQWCEQNNYTIHTYNYWKHCLKEEVASQALPDIVPLAVPDPIPTSQLDNTHHSIQPVSSLTINDPNCSNRAMISLKSGDISIEFDSNISEEFLRTIVTAK